MKRSWLFWAMFAVAFSASAQDVAFNRGVQFYNKDNFKEALIYLLPLSNQGFPEAQYYVGWCYLRKDINPNLKQIINLWESATMKKHSASAYSLGQLYEYGENYGMKGNIKKALNYYRKAADLENSDALYTLFKFYSEGKYVEKDDSVAFGFCRRAAHANSYYNDCLGNLFLNGTGVAASRDSAFVAYSTNPTDLKDRDKEVLLRLSKMHLNDSIAKPDTAKALNLLMYLSEDNYGNASELVKRLKK